VVHAPADLHMALEFQIRTQFLTESILLAVLGGIVGVLVGIPRHGYLRQHEALGRRHPRRSVVGRHRLRHPDRRVRRPHASHPSLPATSHRGTAHGMSGEWTAFERPRVGRCVPPVLDLPALPARALADAAGEEVPAFDEKGRRAPRPVTGHPLNEGAAPVKLVGCQGRCC
jgi:hypothetical protein